MSGTQLNTAVEFYLSGVPTETCRQLLLGCSGGYTAKMKLSMLYKM